MILYDKSVFDTSVVGGKGRGLNRLVSYGYNVPDFFVISAGTQLDDTHFAAVLDAYAAKLHCEKFAVRSSNVGEDGLETSFAGQFTTELNVKRSDLYGAVCKVAASSVNMQTAAYSRHFATTTSEMAIVVQAQVDAEYSGVMFTTSPFDRNCVLIEQVSGTGEQLVSGNVTPTRMELAKRADGPSGLINELICAANRLEEKEGYPLDMEWAYKNGKLYLLQMRPLTALDDVLPDIPKSDWNLYVYRNFCLFSQSVQRRASESELQSSLFGFSMPITEGLLVNGREFYTPRNDMICNDRWKLLDNGSFFEDFIHKLNLSVNKTKRWTRRLLCADFSNVDDEALWVVYKRNITAYVESYVPLMMRPDDYLQGELQRILGENAASIAIANVTALARSTYYASEQVDFLQAVLNDTAEQYLEKYEWINNPLGKKLIPLTHSDFLSRVQHLTKAQATLRLRKIKAQRSLNRRNAKAFLNTINDNDTKRLIELIVTFVGMRTYTAEHSDRFFYYIRSKILSEIAKRLNLTQEKLTLMTLDEVMALKHCSVTSVELAKRSRGCMTVFSEGLHTTYYGGRTYKVLAELLPAPSDNEQLVRGKIACPGEVTARVKVINSFEETNKLNEGEIIVTSMTTPELTLALEKASGIITDEGGITCHAAIIAREYGVPCLVGTRNATSLLCDGMLVQLDCIHGSFKILED